MILDALKFNLRSVLYAFGHNKDEGRKVIETLIIFPLPTEY